jgi:citrate synthase
VTHRDTLVTTSQAADLLGVKTSTVYTYVSRGHLEPIRRPGDPGSWFNRFDVEQLASSNRRRRPQPRGEPSNETTHLTSITSITDRGYQYRGLDPLELATSRTFEEVAEFLWTGALPGEVSWPGPSEGELDHPDVGSLPLDRLRVAISELGIRDQLRFGKTPEAIRVTGRTVLVDLMAALPPVGGAPETPGFVDQLWPRLASGAPQRNTTAALESAMIIIADHGVAPSTLAVRIAAGYRADLYGAIQSGMAIMAGGWYGRRALSAERMLDDVDRVGDAEQVVGDLFRQGGIPCLGQPRYAGPDPRTEMILDLTASAAPDAPALRAVRDIQRITADRALPSPSVELALAAMCRAFDLITGASEAVFALGRTAGWIAHAIETYDRPIASPPVFEYTTTDLRDVT